MNNELYHYGVKGMKWGVRKDRPSNGGSRKRRKKTSTRSKINKVRNYTGGKSSAAVRKYRRKDIDGMSNAELQKAVNRMNLERQYRDLTKIDISRGKKEADKVLGYADTYRKTKRFVKTTKAAATKV